MTNLYKFQDYEQDKQQFLQRQLHSITFLKSSYQTNTFYAEAYTYACRAVKLDTLAKYIEAKDAYKKVIKVINTK